MQVFRDFFEKSLIDEVNIRKNRKEEPVLVVINHDLTISLLNTKDKSSLSNDLDERYALHTLRSKLDLVVAHTRFGDDMPKTVWVDCPICRKRIEVDVDEDTAKEVTHYPFSVVNVHGTPSHLLVIYIDAQWQVRGVESHKTLVTEDVRDRVALALRELESRGKLIKAQSLLNGFSLIRGVEYADLKGLGIISLKEPGPTIDNIFSPTGRIKGRVIVEEHAIEPLEALLPTAFEVLEKADPLSVETFRLFLKMLEESVNTEYTLNPEILLVLANSSRIMPKIIVKDVMFDAMKNYSLTDDIGVEEISTIQEKLDGYFTLGELIEIIQEKKLSPFRFLMALEKLRIGEAIRYQTRGRAMWGPI